MNFVLRIVLSDSDSKKKMENCYAHAQSWFRVLVIKNSLIQIKPILTKLIFLLFMSISIKSIYHNSRKRKVMWSHQTKLRKFNRFTQTSYNNMVPNNQVYQGSVYEHILSQKSA